MKDFKPWKKARIEDDAYDVLEDNGCKWYLLVLRNAIDDVVSDYSSVKIWKGRGWLKPKLYIRVYGDNSGKEAVKMEDRIQDELWRTKVAGHNNPVGLSVSVW